MDTPDLAARAAALRDAVDARYAALLTAVFAFALWIRLLPRRNMEYLQALDPYVISRMAEAIVREGHLPLIDVWRYFPFVTPTYHMNLGDIFIPAYLYRLAAPYGVDFVAWTQIYPAIAGALMVVALYYTGRELFDRRAGILAAFFLAASPAVLHRSSAGWFEKEPFAAFLMIASIYFVTRAWKREEWWSGAVAGAAFGVSLTVWGGARFLALFYPLVAFPVALMDEDIERLLVAFTPTLIVGHVLAATLNPSRWSVPNDTFVFGLGVLGLIWARYLAAEYELVPERQLGYVVPGLTALGAVLTFLSPLYSQTIAGYARSVVNKALQSSSAVVASTVAENQGAPAGQLISQLGAVNAQSVFGQWTVLVSEFVSGWTLGLIGTGILLVILGGMLARTYLDIETVTPREAYAVFGVVFSAFLIGLMALLPGGDAMLFLAAGFVLVVGLPLLYLLPDDVTWAAHLGIAVVALAVPAVLAAQYQQFVVLRYAVATALVGVAAVSLAPPEGNYTVSFRWELIIPLAWILATLYGAAQRSRLLFLAAHPLALMAGFAVAATATELRRSQVWDRLADRAERVDATTAFRMAAAVLLIPVLLINGAAAVGMAQNIGGSPNQLWMENLDFMREETPVDSVVLSWWDYGYWFETIGARAAIADGGNMQFYNDATDYKIINWPLADFLTASDTASWMGWLEDLSVDYVVLDSTMIGKYSAVSTIHNRGDATTSLITADCRRQGNQCASTRASDNRTYIPYRDRQSGTEFLAPVAQRGSRITFDGAPLVRTPDGTAPVANVCTEGGIVPTDPETNGTTLPGCVAFHPYRQHQSLVYVPRDAMNSTLVKLYVMDAPNMEHFTEVFDNGFVKMWRVDTG